MNLQWLIWPRLVCGCAAYLLFALAWQPAHALLLAPQAGLSQATRLAGHLALRCSANRQETITEVAASAHASEFVDLPGLLSKGYTDDICWLRFTLQRAPSATHDWFIEVDVPYLDDVTLFIPQQGRGTTAEFQSVQLGDRVPFSARPVPHRRFVFPVLLPNTEPVTGYLRIQTTSTMLVEAMNVWQYPGLLAATQADTALYWLVFGLIVLGALSNLVFWIWLRESIYRSYTLYLIALLAFSLTNSGFGAQWLWPDSPILADRMIGVLLGLTYLAGILFFDQALGLRQSFSRLRYAIPAVMVFYAACSIAAAAGYYERVVGALQLVALIATIAIFLAGPWLIWRGKKNLWLYILAFSVPLMSSFTGIGRNLGLWSLTIPLDHLILGATTIHIVLLNFAMADRVRQSQREKLALEKTSARLEAEQDAIALQREFMAMVTHEFRTPLTIIDTSAQRIASSPQRDQEKLRERCGNIRAATKRMTLLMDGFLTLDRIEGDHRTFTPAACKPDDIIQRVVAEFDLGRIKVSKTKMPKQISCDAVQLRIALGNLLANALRYSPPGKKVGFSVCGLPNGGIEFSVKDEGPGIPADEIPKLFQKYFRGRAAQTQPGAGLGLYLVDRIVELHGGSIEVESSLGAGSRFVLLLP